MAKDSILYENNLLLFQEDVDRMLSSSQYNTKFKKVLYDERIRTSKQILNIHKDIKNHAGIKYCYTSIDKYKNKNLFVDLGYYNRSFMMNYVKKLGTSNG